MHCVRKILQTPLLCDVKVCVPSDWLPTFLSLANSSHLVEGLGLDGVDQTRAFRSGEQVGGGGMLGLTFKLLNVDFNSVTKLCSA